MKELQGKTAFITGGSRGIGRAIAIRLAEHGVNSIINYVRHKRNAEETVEAVREKGVECQAIKANIADEKSLARMFSVLDEQKQQIDYVVSNAASGVLKPALELTTRHWDWAMNINARALLSLTKQVIPFMNPGGRIITISSLGSVRALPDYTAVGASKAALESLVRHLAVELGPKGILINTISAGVVDTDALKKFPARDQILQFSLDRTPLGRLTTPEDVANVALFLCSDLATMIHGQVITVDGGYAIQG
ncbi:enoyl-[acyl-carrier-protein] reductase FabL [Desulfogranum japonicum]|uniref:enoyl-[acyl-carrier-protein] reductase FabL n=1 Tax=Desulfogranum japonicum TaxID=231447 RepID=UPI000413A20B|nr:enoyl-[acyl-carrier-protein] reductase FabL [Desulfogranum japonicum]